MERKNVYICMLAALLSCSDSVKVSRTLDAMPAIFPDYNGVVIPPNMAPLNFALEVGVSRLYPFGETSSRYQQWKGAYNEKVLVFPFDFTHGFLLWLLQISANTDGKRLRRRN